jgi:centrin-3
MDTNKDGLVSINEFCLCIEGVQQSLEQRLKQFDPQLEKELRAEIDELFKFFDTNKDDKISQEELRVAVRAQQPLVTQREVEAIMRLADKNQSGQIDREEFMEIMLPQMKQEIMSYERNLDELRRLFKQFDLDQTNYLSKANLKSALSHLGIALTDVQLEDFMLEIDLDQNKMIDIDEFVAFLSVAEQLKFKNPNNKSVVVKIKHARKLQAMDFYNCFKNLPQSFQPTLTQEHLEKRYTNTPSFGLYPQFDSKTMSYKDLAKLEDYYSLAPRQYVQRHQPFSACELTIEEALNVPIPKKEDFAWNSIKNREVRAYLVDMRTKDILSNTWIVSTSWREDQPTKWSFASPEVLQASGRQVVMRSQQWSNEITVRDVHLVFEFVLFVN